MINLPQNPILPYPMKLHSTHKPILGFQIYLQLNQGLFKYEVLGPDHQIIFIISWKVELPPGKSKTPTASKNNRFRRRPGNSKNHNLRYFMDFMDTVNINSKP